MRRWQLALALAAVVVVVSGCGGGGGGNSEAEKKASLEDAATARVERSSAKVADAVKDKYLPGPKRTDAVCTVPDLPEGVDTGYEISCHVESYSAPLPGRGSVFIWSEDWSVPVDQNGKLGNPVIAGEYRIRNYLRRDNKYNCSNHKTRPEVCTGQLPAKFANRFK